MYKIVFSLVEISHAGSFYVCAVVFTDFWDFCYQTPNTLRRAFEKICSICHF